ncbi:MAG: AI-2E family transporter [Polyangiaceae bacterium]
MTKGTRERALFLSVFAVGLAVCWPLIVPIGAGAVLAYVSESPINAVDNRFKARGRNMRWAISAVFITLVLATFLVPMAFAGYSAVKQVYRFLAHADFDTVTALPMRWLTWASWKLGNYGIDVPVEQAITKLREWALTAAASAAQWAGDALSGAPSVLFDVSVTILAWWAFATDGPKMRKSVLPILLPWEREREIISKITGEVLRGVILANVLVAAVQALCAVVFLVAFDVPNSFSLGVLAFFLSFIPVFGTAPITVGGVLYLFSQQRTVPGIVMLCVAVGVGSVDNVIRPLLMRSSAELSFFWGLVALVGGVTQFGLAGTVIGPLAFSLVVAFLEAFDFAHEIPGFDYRTKQYPLPLHHAPHPRTPRRS